MQAVMQELGAILEAEAIAFLKSPEGRAFISKVFAVAFPELLKLGMKSAGLPSIVGLFHHDGQPAA